MKSVPFFMQRFFTSTFYLGIAAFVFAVLLFPTKTVLRLIHLSAEELNTGKYHFGIFSICFGIFLSYFLALFWKDVRKTQFIPFIEIEKKHFKPCTKSWFFVFEVLFCLLILLRVILGIEQPFDSDELTLPLRIIQNDFHPSLGWLFNDGAHPIGTISSYISMKLFGLSMYTARVPAVILSSFFLLAVFNFCKRARLKPITVVLIYSHLLASEISTWYMHSTRGYISMMLATFLLFIIVYETINEIQALSIDRLVAFCVILLILPFTHGFSVVFALMLFSALLAWYHLSKEKLSVSIIQSTQRLIIAELCFLPYLASYLLVTFSLTLPKYRNIDPESFLGKSNLIGELPLTLGTSHFIVVKILFLSLVGFIISTHACNKKIKDTFTPLVLVFVLGFTHTFQTYLRTYITARFLLAIPILFIFWFSESVNELPRKYANSLLGLAFICFVIFPFFDGDNELFQLSRKDYFNFVKASRFQLKGVPKSCLEFSHSGAEPASTEELISSKFYFPVRTEERFNCNKRYLLHFGWPWQEDPGYTKLMKQHASFSDLPSGKSYKEIFSDGKGRFLAEIVND